MAEMTRPECAARLQRWLDGDQTYVPEDAIAAAVAYLRSPAPGAEAMREALIEVAARARMNFITTDEAWADRHQPCPMTKAVTPIVDDWLARHPLPAHVRTEAMRDALIAVAQRAVAERCPHEHCLPGDLCATCKQIGYEVASAYLDALPAPEVPEAVREWCRYMDSAQLGTNTVPAHALRDWIREEYGL